MRQVIWSNYENSPFIENEALKEGFDISTFTKEDMLNFICKYERENKRVLEEVIKKQFDKQLNQTAVCLLIAAENVKGVNQKVVSLGDNLNSIFNIPYDYVTWYIDAWNIRADVYVKGVLYRYVFRELRENRNSKHFFENVNKGRKLLTPTYMGNYTMTLCMKKRKKRVYN